VSGDERGGDDIYGLAGLEAWVGEMWPSMLGVIVLGFPDMADFGGVEGGAIV